MPKPPPDPRQPTVPEEVAKPKKRSKIADWPVTLRIRHYEKSNMTDVWLIKGKGVTHSLLWGQMSADTAELLSEKLGIRVEHEHSPWPFTPSILPILQET